MSRKILIVALAGLFLGCNNRKTETMGAHDHAHDDHSTSVTRWTDELELFAEIAPIVVGNHVDAIVHLTTLSDYKPVLAGDVNIMLHPHGGESFSFPAAYARPGIFIGHIEMRQAGLYDVEITFDHNELAASFDGGHIRVYRDEKEMEEYAHVLDQDHSHEEDGDHTHASDAHDHGNPENDPDHSAGRSAHLVTFLKEQQWKTDFRTAIAEERRVASSIVAISEIIPHQHGYAEVVAPVDGLLLVEHNQEMAVPGKRVKRGEQLLVLCPPIGASNTWLDRQLEYERAKREFERAEKLLERDAISMRDYEQIRQAYTIEKANYETLLQNFSAGGLEEGSSCLLLRSPINGIVADVAVLPGQNIDAGERMMTVIDPTVVWIRAQLFEKDIDKLGEPAGLSVRLQGSNRLIEFDPKEFELLSTGMMLDPHTRTIRVLFEVQNPGNLLKIGQIVQTEIHTTQYQEMLAIPASAIIDEEIEQVVFIQIEGESFEKRSVKTGPAFGDWIAIRDGLNKDERIVTKGAYAVKLASANVSIGHAHVH